MMTFRRAREVLTPLGMTIRHDSTYGEYRVGFRGENDDRAYFTNNLPDAVSTARHMAFRHYEMMYNISITEVTERGRVLYHCSGLKCGNFVADSLAEIPELLASIAAGLSAEDIAAIYSNI